MNIFYLPNNLKSVFLENKNIQVFEHVYKLLHLRATVVPRYFMSYDALPLLNNREKEYMEFMYRKQNHSNSTMEFYYLWKQKYFYIRFEPFYKYIPTHCLTL